MSGIALIVPPGWTLHAGGPHMALPILKGFLQQHDISTHLYDLNIDSVRFYQVSVSEQQAIEATKALTRDAMNTPYFNAEDTLQSIAHNFQGTWFAQEGYRYNHCNLSSPESIKHCSTLPSPFSDFLKKQAIPNILSKNPDIIGITLIVPSQILQTFELVRLLRAADFKGIIVLGGNIITRIYHDMAFDWVFDLIDGIVQLQGEQVLLKLYKELQGQRNFHDVPNLMWRSAEGIVQNKATQLQPIDFQGPDFSDLPVGQYWGTNYLTMLGARGCYYGKCSFCAIPYGYGKKGYIGRSPATRVLQYMQDCVKQYGVNRFKFVDEAFHPKLMRELAPLIIKEGFKCTFEGYFRLESTWLNPELLNECFNAGLRKMYIGLELIPSEKRNLLTKSDHADPLIFLKMLKEIGIKAHVFCMFGFPGTGVKEAFETIEFALKHHTLIDTLDVFPFYYARHTKVNGVEIIKEPENTWNVEHRYRPIISSALPPKQVNILAEQLSEVIWASHPQWLHPIYRMSSPWHDL